MDPNHHYVLEKSELQGVREITNLSHAARKTKAKETEELWLFIKGRDANNKIRNFWFEIGVNEQPKSVENDKRALNQISEFLKKRQIQVLKGVEYHYHPHESPQNGMEFGSYFPSPADLSNQIQVQENWEKFKMGGTFHSGVINQHGAWHFRYTGTLFANNPFRRSRQQSLLNHQADRVLDSLTAQARMCLSAHGVCDGFYTREANQHSTPLLKIGFQPAGRNKPPPGKIFPQMEPHLQKIIDPQEQPFFRGIYRQMRMDGQRKGTKFSIVWKDKETGAHVFVTSRGDHVVRFKYVIDSNDRPEDGRVYMVDTFVFDKSGNYKPERFNRAFALDPSHPKANKLMDFADRYTNQVKMPTRAEQLGFARRVARFFLSLPTER